MCEEEGKGPRLDCPYGKRDESRGVVSGMR